MDYPKTYNENMAWRREMLLRCKHDRDYRAKVKELFHRDILFAFNGFFYTLDVRKRPFQHQPFCTYDYQDDAILELQDAIKSSTALHTLDVLWEKSRDMGATWIILGTFMHFWLDPYDTFDFLAGSRKEDYVDKIGDPRTHFSKLRYLVDRFPKWILPKKFNRRLHDTYMKLQNPDTGSTITGESNNANFSTQGRYTAILFDEFAKWESTDIQAWTAAGDATPCRVANSTPFGAAGKYYELSTDGKTKKIVMHWSLHPEKAEGLACLWPKPEDADELVDSFHWVGLTSPWYERERLRRSPLEVAQELDIDYIGAGNPVFDGKAGKRIGALLRAGIKAKHFFKVDLVEQRLVETINPVEHEDYFVVYAEPDPKCSYIVAADVAEGKETGDYSVCKVLCRETKSCAGSYRAQIDEIQFAQIINLITKYYTPEGAEEPWWAVETNSCGLATFDILTEYLDLPNAFMMPKFDVTKQGVSYRKGWWSDTNSRRMLVAGIKEWLLAGEGWVDGPCCREMTVFVRNKNGKPEAKAGCNDDEVMAWGIALQVHEIAPYEGYKEPTVPREDNLPADPYDKEIWQQVKEPTVEERCLAQSLQYQRVFVDQVVTNDLIGSLFEHFEDLDYGGLG